MSEDDSSIEDRPSREYKILPNHSAFFDILREADARTRSMKLQTIELCIEDDDPTVDGTLSVSSTKIIKLDASWRSHIPELLQQLAGGIYIDKKHLKKAGSLGEGGFAIVEKMEMQSEDGTSKEMVAVKKLKPGVIEDDEDLKELVEESNLLRRVRHMGIVEFKGIGCFDETSVDAMRSSIFLAEEFMAGGTLKTVVMNQMRSETKRLYWMDDAWRWLLQIAEALAYLHSCSPTVIHRDVKPENVLMSSKEWSTAVAKIADFGLHKRMNRVHQLQRAKSSHLMGTVSDILESSTESEMHHPQPASACIDIPKSSESHPVRQSDLSSYSLDIPSHFRIIKKSSSLSGIQRDSPLWMVPEDSPLMDNDIGYHHLSSAYSVPQALITEDFSPIHLITPKRSSIEASSLGVAVDRIEKESNSEGDHSSASLETHPSSEKRVRGGQLGHLMGWIQNNSDKIASSQARTPVALEQTPFEECVSPASLHFLFEPNYKMQPKSDVTENKQHGSHQAFNQLNSIHEKHESKPKPELKKPKSVRYALGLSGTEDVSGVVGSLMYMAPEVYKGKHYNEKVDVFGFGVVMYELLMSELVIVRVLMQANRPSEMQSMLKKHAKSVAKGFREDIPYYWPEAIQDLIRDCWHQRPERRPKMTEVVQRLKDLKEAGCVMEMDERLARRMKKRDPRCCSFCIVH